MYLVLLWGLQLQREDPLSLTLFHSRPARPSPDLIQFRVPNIDNNLKIVSSLTICVFRSVYENTTCSIQTIIHIYNLVKLQLSLINWGKFTPGTLSISWLKSAPRTSTSASSCSTFGSRWLTAVPYLPARICKTGEVRSTEHGETLLCDANITEVGIFFF